MNDLDRQIITGLVREPRARAAFETWLGSKIHASTAALRTAVQQGKWKDAALAEGELRAYEDLLLELTRP